MQIVLVRRKTGHIKQTNSRAIIKRLVFSNLHRSVCKVSDIQTRSSRFQPITKDFPIAGTIFMLQLPLLPGKHPWNNVYYSLCLLILYWNITDRYTLIKPLFGTVSSPSFLQSWTHLSWSRKEMRLESIWTWRHIHHNFTHFQEKKLHRQLLFNEIWLVGWD